MEQTAYDRITALVEQYNEKLKPYGVECTAKRRFVTSKALHSTPPHHNILGRAEDYILEKRENTLYHNTPNKYKTIVISVNPLKKGIVAKKDCKKYSYIVEAIEREHIGKQPKYKIRSEEKVFRSIEKRLEKIKKRAEKEKNIFWCKSSLADRFRYAISEKYN